MSATDSIDGVTKSSVPERGKPARAWTAIGWAFLGIRKGGESERDAAQVGPLQWVAVGLVAAVVFVALLMVAVRWVVAA